MTDIASHRGGAGLWPENSRLAFRNSAAMAVDFVEFDMHCSRDGVLVVHHDPALGRTTAGAGAGAIADRDWAELKQMTLLGTDGETIPILAEVLDILSPCGVTLRIELKNRPDGSRYPGIETEILAALEETRLLDRTTFTSFDLATLADLVAMAPARPLIWLIADSLLVTPERDLAALCRRACAAGVPEIAIRIKEARADDVNVCRKDTIARIRQIIAATTPDDIARDDVLVAAEQPEQAPEPHPPCLCCGGRMILVERFAPGTAPRTIFAVRIDTS